MAEWTFLTNHARVLIFLNRNTGITGRELALRIGITERAVRKIYADLEKEGYLQKTKIGRRIKYRVDSKLPLRHPTQQSHTIELLLTAVNF
jgi:predicted transcriptional regulator